MILKSYFSKLTLQILFILCYILAFQAIVQAQCKNSIQYPAYILDVPIYQQPKQLTTNSYPGQYIKLQGLEVGKNYKFSSAESTDIIAIWDKSGNVNLAAGVSPVSYLATAGNDIITVHINAPNTFCGYGEIDRAITVQCTNCAPSTSNVSIGTEASEATLDVNGNLKIGTLKNDPTAGMIRWNQVTKDFEGFNGTLWVSLTKANSSSWGKIAATEFNENDKLVASNAGDFNDFGWSICISGDYAIIGAAYDYNTDYPVGLAFIFLKTTDGWVQQETLSENKFQFGSSVSISGDYAIVGSPYYSNEYRYRGTAYVYKRNGTRWYLDATINSPEVNQNDEFGTSVSISGNHAIIGTTSGKAYTYLRSGSNWTLQASLVPYPSVSNSGFGRKVFLSGDYAIIGAPFYNNYRGAAYIFIRNGVSWLQQPVLTASDGAANDYFGSSVAIAEDYAIIGAPQDDIGSNTDQGSAYIFGRSGSNWTQQAKLTVPGGAANDKFGGCVSISNDYAVVGGQVLNSDQATALLYSRSQASWSLEAKLMGSKVGYDERLVNSVFISGNEVFVGVPNGRVVYIFRQNE